MVYFFFWSKSIFISVSLLKLLLSITSLLKLYYSSNIFLFAVKNKERPKRTQVNTPNSIPIIINDIMVHDNF